MTFPESWAINALKPASTLAQITHSLRLDGDQFGWLSLINAAITGGVALKTLAFAFDTSSSLVTVVRANLADDIYVRHESTFLVFLVVLGIHKSGSLTNVLETRQRWFSHWQRTWYLMHEKETSNFLVDKYKRENGDSPFPYRWLYQEQEKVSKRKCSSPTEHSFDKQTGTSVSKAANNFQFTRSSEWSSWFPEKFSFNLSLWVHSIHFSLRFKRNHSTIELASKDGSLGLDFGAVQEQCSGPKSQLIIYNYYQYYYYYYCWNWQENGAHSRWLSELACYVITSSYHNIRHAFLYEACFLLPDEFTTCASDGILSERLFAVSQGFLSCYSCCRREARFAIFDLRRLKHVVDRTWVVIAIVIPPRFSRSWWNFDGFDRFTASLYVWQRFDVAGVETTVSLFDAWARRFHSSS